MYGHRGHGPRQVTGLAGLFRVGATIVLSQFGAGDRQAGPCHRPTAIGIGPAAPAQAQILDLQAAAVLSVRARPCGHQLAVRLRVEDLHMQQRVLAAHGAYLFWGYQIMGRIKYAPESPVYDAMLLRPA
ncbi:hypothetical protein ACPCAJ_33600 [Streptomyces griseoincarnatus]